MMAETVDLADQRCSQLLDFAQHGADAADFGLRAGGRDDPDGLTAGDQRARIGHAATIGQPGVLGNRPGGLAHGH